MSPCKTATKPRYVPEEGDDMSPELRLTFIPTLSSLTLVILVVFTKEAINIFWYIWHLNAPCGNVDGGLYV